MTDRVPSFFLLVPGPWEEAEAVLGVLAAGGVDAVRMGESPIEAGQVRVDVVHEESFGRALAYGRLGPLPEDLVARADACSTAALLEIGMRLDTDPKRVAAIGRLLRDAGGVAVRNEASGGATPWDAWIAQLESEDPARLYANGVVVVGDDDGVFTCGMHHFDLPDVEMSDPASRENIAWLEAFCVFQLAENPELGSGHTFRPDADAAPRKIERWPDHRHHPSDGRHNPFGLWRVLAPGDPGLDALDRIPVLVPGLVATLLHTERARGRPLTQEEVEHLRDECPAIAMDLAGALQLERSRGYADLEPRRAWEQWRIVREHYG